MSVNNSEILSETQALYKPETILIMNDTKYK